MDMKTGAGERRKDLRVFIKKPLVLKFNLKKQNRLFKLLPGEASLADNMSVGGISLALPALDKEQIDEVVKGGGQIVLEFNIPLFREPLKVTGKIAWIKRRDKTGGTVYISGVSFQNLRQEDREKLLLRLLDICVQGECRI